MAEIEERLARLEVLVERTSIRLNHIESRLTWMLGIMITMWGHHHCRSIPQIRPSRCISCLIKKREIAVISSLFSPI